MREQIGSVTLEGPTLRVVAPEPLAVEPKTLLVATAIRVFERYPVLDRLVLTIGGSTEIAISRDQVERLLEPDGFASLREWGRWRQVLARAVQAYAQGGAR